MLLGGDLGGTKTLLALAEIDDGRLRIIRRQRYASQDYHRFEDLLADFIPDQPAIASACFGVAGPTDGRLARLTYLPWQLAAGALETRFGIRRVALLNDLAATAHGLPLVTEQDIRTLHAGQPIARAPRVMLGAGTGLGVAGLIWLDGEYRVIPGEGGHCGFSPQTPEQGELGRWLLARQGRVTIEDVVSGPGLARIHAFLGGAAQTPEAIGQAALNGNDPLARAALRLWLECLGAFAGDLALHWLARGGVYLAGGLVAGLLPQLDPGPFIQAFLAKREHRELVAAMPVHALICEDLGLFGALAHAATL